jgi:hypothetical protein
MMIFAAVLSVLLAIVALAAGLPKVRLTGDIPAQLQAGGLSATLVRFIGLAELAAAGGLITACSGLPSVSPPPRVSRCSSSVLSASTPRPATTPTPRPAAAPWLPSS